MNQANPAKPLEPLNPLNPRQLPIVLVLQGGGALGAYQAGVYQALHEYDLIPDWVLGTSIGAINGALIAGNQKHLRLSRLKEFWDRVSHRDSVDMNLVSDAQRRSNIWLTTMDAIMRGVPGFFLPRRLSGFPFGVAVAPEQASFYDTQALHETLRELVDFDYLNQDGAMRLSVNAIKVKSGELAHFDSRSQAIGAEHVRASGALPPGFPGIRINGELYWDGGLYSNTPLESVLQDLPQRDTLCFMVDLWSAEGDEPLTLDEVQTRQKDITYASRSQRHIADYAKTHLLQNKLRELYQRLPPGQRSAADAEALAKLGCVSTMHVVRLPYSGQDWHMALKDVNFSKGSIAWRWDLGYKDAMRALRHAGWLQLVTESTAIVVHELPSQRSRAGRRQAST
ncbi:MAG: patatin-like phospholipase family protein [Pseudomonadota bacterium]